MGDAYYHSPPAPEHQSHYQHLQPSHSPSSPSALHLPPSTQTRDCVALDLLADAATSAASSPPSPSVSTPSHYPLQPQPAEPPTYHFDTHSHPSHQEQPPTYYPSPQSYPRLPPPFPSSSHFPPHGAIVDFPSPHPRSAPALRSPFDSFPQPLRSSAPQPHPQPQQPQQQQQLPPQESYGRHRFATYYPRTASSNTFDPKSPATSLHLSSTTPSSSHSQFPPWQTSQFDDGASGLRPRSLSCGANLDKHAKGILPFPPQPAEPNTSRTQSLAYPSTAISQPNAVTSSTSSPVSRRNTPVYHYMTPNGTTNGHGTAPSPSTTKSGRRTSYLRFTQEEERMLEEGVRVFGHGNWKRILNAYCFHPKRSPVDLKDKWRNLSRSKAKKAAARLSSATSNPDLHILFTSDMSESSSSFKTPPSVGASPGTAALSQSPSGVLPSRSVQLPPIRPQTRLLSQKGPSFTSEDAQMADVASDNDHPFEARSM